MNIPDQYKWLLTVGDLPKVITNGLSFLGVQEIVGKGSNKTIISWRDELNQAGVKIDGYSDDDIPWCGLFVAYICFKAGKSVVKDPLWARNWANFGSESKSPSLGDVLTFGRDGGGHVGFYIAEDDVCYHVLGGNQSNKVCITRINKNRLLKSSNQYNSKPASAKPYKVAASGNISKNES
jgi:uncharacterized protein (TIGR02594 family)